MEDRFVGERPETGVWCPDTLKIAQAYGIKAFRINNANEIDNVVNKVLAEDGPVICEVMTPEWQLLIPRITSDKQTDGRLVALDYEDMFPFIERDELLANMNTKNIKAKR